MVWEGGDMPDKYRNSWTIKLNTGPVRVYMVAIILMVIGLNTGPVQSAEPIQMGIMTGGPKGTYYQFGLNIQTLINAEGIELRVDNSNGSVENIYAVYQKPDPAGNRAVRCSGLRL